jgi:hypothetical protein
MRVPVAVSLESRDGSLDKDSKVVNGVVEAKESPVLRKRPGITDNGLIHSGTAQLLYSWNGINAMIGDTLYRGTVATIVSGPGTTAFSPSVSGLRFDAQEVGASAATQLLMVKNRTQGWTVDQTGAKSSISFPAGIGSVTYPVASLTRSGTTATASLAVDPGLSVGDSITVAGAGQSAYNITATVTAVTPYSSTPATTVPISSLTRSGTTATAVADTPHGLTNGSSYAISGASQTAYNITATVTVVDDFTFTYPVTVTAEAPATPATGSPALANQSWSVTGLVNVRTDGSVTAATTTHHDFVVGDSITVSGDPGGATNGTWTVASVTSSTGFTFNVSTTGMLYSTGNVITFAITHTAPAVSSITRSGSTATLTTASTHHFSAARTVTVSGCSQSQYNKTFIPLSASGSTITYTVTVTAEQPTSPATGTPVVTTSSGSVTNATVSYTVAGSPTTPATGTITLTANFGTVPGIPYIDGYFFVMDTNGVMWASAIDDPTSWPALNNLTAQNRNGAGKALGRTQNYLVAFKEWSTEFFYDAKQLNFPYLPVDNGFTEVGCASGESVAYLDGNAFWIAQVKENGRSVYMMSGLQQQKISTPDVDRILDADGLTTVYAYGVKLGGHSYYVLTLESSEITLVYDLTSQSWYQWTSLTAGSAATVSSITASGSVATITTATAHGVSDGDPVLISATGYSQIFQASYVSSTVFTVASTALVGLTGSITATPYTSSYFAFTKSCDYAGASLLLHETNGHLYQFNTSAYQDAGVPIDLFFRTARMDGGSTEVKTMSRCTVIGDAIADTMMLRQSDDDCQTFSAYRPVDLSLERPSLRRLGKFRRRTIEGRHVGNTNPRIEALELEIP